MSLTIVKLGGSQMARAELGAWLAAIAGSAAQVLVVPGGGAFADTVRALQPRLGLDDRAAHDMALMAMGQFARALAALAPLRYADDWAGLRAGGHAVWSPWPMLREMPGIAQSWDVTSDSLAAWLACRLRASRLLLVKARPAESGDAGKLVSRGLVDAAFPRFLRPFAGEARIAGPDDAVRGLDPLPGLPVSAS